MKKIIPFLLAAVLPASALLAQTAPTPAPAPTIQPEEVEEDVVGSLDNDAKIAIPAFATNADVPTQTSAGSTSTLGFAMANVIFSDLRNNGLFKPSGPASLPRPALSQVQAPDYGGWRSRGADMLVQGYVRAEAGGNISVGCYLYDVALGQQRVKAGWTVAPGDWRRAAHKCADLVYSNLSGENPFFDSRVAYIAETGPKDRRMKRLSVMDHQTR